MPTTFEVFAGKRASNYSTLPKIDVEILPGPRLCEDCPEPIRFESSAVRPPFGAWVHVSPTFDDHHRARPRLACTYCGSQDPAEVRFQQMPYSDETSCSRCGGVHGYAIGD